ncbi:hypothetical protein PVAG01_11149 [Phlyctema vagabunda]|uniref:C2H2-type domain-containing protein n=1 Tax=Phlyctema vagabunda TaxID=108571 RepID=A0ABR4P1G5_9HELO
MSGRQESSSESDGTVDFDSDDESYDHDTERAIVKAVAPDLELASHLISTLGKWRGSKEDSGDDDALEDYVIVCPASAGAARTTSGVPYLDSSTEGVGLSTEQYGRKRYGYPRRKRSKGSAQDEEDDNESDDQQEQQEKNVQRAGPANNSLRLACPFHKMNPSKFGAQLNQPGNQTDREFRPCAGPGFGSIALLKEHLKRKHYPVRCDRCHSTFDVKGNRPAAIALLETHTRSDVRCVKTENCLPDSISDFQWACLNEKKRKRGQSSQTSTVEKWNEIWKILFPNRQCPKTPWYDDVSQDSGAPQDIRGMNSYLKIFDETLNHKLPRIATFLEEQKPLMMDFAKQVFQVWSAVSIENDAILQHLDQQPSGSRSSWGHLSNRSSISDHPGELTPVGSSPVMGNSFYSALLPQDSPFLQDSDTVDNSKLGANFHIDPPVFTPVTADLPWWCFEPMCEIGESRAYTESRMPLQDFDWEAFHRGDDNGQSHSEAPDSTDKNYTFSNAEKRASMPAEFSCTLLPKSQ